MSEQDARHSATTNESEIGPESEHAEQLAHALESLEKGAKGLGELHLEPERELVELVPMAHLLRASGPTGRLSDERRDDIWNDVQGRLERAASRATRREPKRSPWRYVIAGLATAAATLVLLFVVPKLLVEEQLDTDTRMRAVEMVDQSVPEYTSRLMRPGPEPRGDTRLRDLRTARFEAWRIDTAGRRGFRSLGEYR